MQQTRTHWTKTTDNNLSNTAHSWTFS